MLSYTSLPLMPSIIACLVAVLLGWHVALQRLYSRTTQHAVTHPPPSLSKAKLDIIGIGALLDVFQAYRKRQVPAYILRRSREMSRVYGRDVRTCYTHVLGTKTLVTFDPINIKVMLSTDFASWGVGSLRRKTFFPLLGHADGHAWDQARAVLRPMFRRSTGTDLSLEEKYLQEFILSLPTNADNGWTSIVDMQPLFYRFTLSVATERFFSETCIDQNESGLDKRHNSVSYNGFASAFDEAQAHLARRLMLKDKYWLWNSFSFRKSQQKCHEFVDRYVRLALGRHGKRNPSPSPLNRRKQYNLLEHLCEQTQDPKELRSHLLHILLAARDTTASLLSWTIYFLARDEEVFGRLRQVILETFGTYELCNQVSAADLRSCHYLQDVLKETLRLCPPVPFNARMALKDTTLPRGGGPNGDDPVFVPQGSSVEFFIYLTHHDQAIWGPDADEFRPERWAYMRQGYYEFLPFSAGPRLCLGQESALLSASYCVVRILQRFDRIIALDQQELRQEHITLTLSSGNGVQVRLHRAQAL